MDYSISDKLTRWEAEGRATYLKARAAGLSVGQSMAAATCIVDSGDYLTTFPAALLEPISHLRRLAILCAPQDGVGEWPYAIRRAYAAGARMAMLELGDETEE